MAEVTQQQKKITLDRQVRVTHPGVKDEPTHDGRIEFVRTTAGTKAETDTIGFKSSGGSGTYVEAPIDELFPVLFEIAAAVPGTIPRLEKMLGDFKDPS